MQKTPKDTLLCSLEKTLVRHRLLRKGDGVVVAVSGGVDSMVLADLFSQIAESWRLKLTLAHVNHALRGAASDADETLVRKTAQKLKFPFRSTRWKTRRRGNVQDEARRFRYDFLRRVAARASASCIATAHNRDDQAETLLLHLVRGSGIKGMGGINWTTRSDPKIIRPMLELGRAEIERYAEKRRIPFAHDKSNDKIKYARNFVRHRILPLLESLNPRVRESLAETASILRDCDGALDVVAKAFAGEFLRAGKEKIAWMRGPYLKLPTAIRRHVLISAYEKLKGHRANLNSDQIRRMEMISEGTKPSSRYRLHGRIEFRKTNDLLCMQMINP